MIHLVPYPSGTCTEKEGYFLLADPLGTDCGDFGPEVMKAFCTRMKIGCTAGSDMIFQTDASIAREGYRLEVVKEGITVTASAGIGVIRALTTLVQLADDRKIPCCEIGDAPICSHRGLSLDCARHFFPVEEVKKIIEKISLAKMNVLHWHLSDDQGWRIESERFPKLQETGGAFYTQEEIRDLCSYAGERGVEIIPEIDMPGHVSALLAAYPQYSCFGEPVKPAVTAGIFPIILCPGKDETLNFLVELLDEVISLFPGPRFHIGGDEAPEDEWKKCPDCNARMKALGLSNYRDLQVWFSGKMAGILKSRGKTAVLWNDSLSAECKLPDYVQVQYWTRKCRDTMRAFVEKGGRWIYSDSADLYLDYPYSVTPLKKIYNTSACLGDTDLSGSKGFLGMEAAMWTEYIADFARLEEMLFPRIYALSEIAWCGRRDYDEFRERVKGMTAGFNDLTFTPENGWDPE